jgi:hypothetical protein
VTAWHDYEYVGPTNSYATEIMVRRIVINSIRNKTLSDPEKQNKTIEFLELSRSDRILLVRAAVVRRTIGRGGVEDAQEHLRYHHEIQQQKGITAPVVEAVRISDRVYIVKDGRTRVEEHPEEILDSGKLEEVFFK